MNYQIVLIAVWVLTVIVGGITIHRMWREVRVSSAQLESLDAQVAFLEVEKGALTGEVNSLEERIRLLESEFASTIARSTILNLGNDELGRADYDSDYSLAPGLYSVSSDVVWVDSSGDEGGIRTCDIHNASVEVGGKDGVVSFANVGIAICGVGLPALYLDYDLDGRVDAKLIAGFLDALIAFSADSFSGGGTLGLITATVAENGGLLTNSMRNAQPAYDAFLAKRGEAGFSASSEILERSDRWSQGVWSGFMGEHFDLWGFLDRESGTEFP